MADKKIGILIGNIPSILHGKESHLVTFASEQSREVERICAVTSPREVKSIHYQDSQFLDLPLLLDVLGVSPMKTSAE